MRRLIGSILFATAATVAVAAPAEAAPRGAQTQANGGFCVWIPLINMSVCIPL